MSWFDAASFTSYAKTALASAQKSIDKVLDIEDGSDSSTASQAKTASKESKADKVGTSSTSKNSTKKPSSLTPRTSREKLAVQNDSENSGEDFWSSFLGSSQNTSSSSSSSSSSTKKVSPKKSSRQRDVLSRKKSNTKLTSEKAKAKKTEVTTTNKDIQQKYNRNEDSDLNNRPELLETAQKETDVGNTSRIKHNSRNHEGKSGDETSAQQTVEKSSDKTSDNGSDSDNHESLSGISVVNKTDELDIGNNDHDQEDGSNSQEVKLDSLEMRNDSTSTASEQNESTSGMESTRRMLEFGSIEFSQAQKCDNKNTDTESISEPMATSTPYSHKDTHKTDPTLNPTETTIENDEYSSNDLEDSREVQEIFADHGMAPEQRCEGEKEISSRKQPTEDDFEEDVVVQGVIYMAEDESAIINQEGSVYITTGDIPSAEECTVTQFLEPDENDFQVKSPIESSTVEERNSIITPQESLVSVGGFTELNDGEREENMHAAEGGNRNVEEVQQLYQEISSLKELVDARERRMVDLSKENIDLHETNIILRSQIDQLENMHAGENEEFEEMKEEFTTRIASVENKLHQVSKERDKLQAELDETTAHLTAINERQNEEFSTLIAEKDEQIAQLLSEGEKLSKQELQSNTVIKRLRAKEKENDTLIKNQMKKLEEYEEEVKRLTEILTSRDNSNSKQEDAIIKLNSYVKKQEEQLAKQTSELEDANEKVRSTQVALDNAYKEMTTLQKQTASTEGTIKEAVLSTEMKAKEELRIALEKTRREFQQESEMMALQVADLQASLSRTEQQGTRREENLRQEIKHLQQRLQEAEDRNQELASSVSHATRPLLRQIENLQTTHSGQASTWERVEKNLTERLNEAQNQLLMAQEKERVASQSVSELNSRITRLESQVNSYRAERSRLEADLELERTKNGTLEDAQSRETAKYDAMVKKYQKIIEDTNLDKAHLEQQLTVEKSKMTTEIKKLKTALEGKERILTRQSSFGTVPPPSPSASSESFSQHQDTTDNPSYKGHTRTSSSGSSVVDGLARGMMGGTTALVERLQAQVKQKDGEIELLQDDVTSLRQSRDSVMEEMTSLTTKLEEMEKSHENLKDIKEKYDVLQQRYNAVLQMYGEKEEEAEELRMDLHDVKNMYKQQLEQLFGSAR